MPAGGVDFGSSYNTGFLDMPAIDMRPSFGGDCNMNGHVDINDLTIVLANYNQSQRTGARVTSKGTELWTSTI